ncbi:hypothetical protein VTN77DRAFT_7442 [Rasamsonia byssochlamydoides]|uniref:uncharacterized protein n=1 Tax=Rasamsonia byssochlamydoides TaxID=89139 RepID=UPI003742A987
MAMLHLAFLQSHSELESEDNLPLLPMASNLDLVNEADAFPYHNDDQDVYHFGVANVPATLGFILPPALDVLRGLPHWDVNDATRTVVLTGGGNADERSTVMEQTLLAMREKGRFEVLKRWRHEAFPVYGPNKEVLLTIERCASPLFGITKQTYGGMLDSTAEGGIASGETPLETLVRECEEEAALPPDLVRKHARAVGMISNFYVRGERAGGETNLLQPECHYVYDLPLPPDVVCRQNDDEVEEFHLWTVDEIKQALANREFKPNCIMLDFFIRHGILTAENEKDYIEIVSRLHRRLEFPTR